MRRTLWAAIFAVLACTTTALADGGGVHGRVFGWDPDAGRDQQWRTLGRAVVVASGPSGSFETRSDEHGFFSFIGLVPGVYTLIALTGGYHLDDCSGRPVDIHADEVTERTIVLDSDAIMGFCRPGPAAPLVDPDSTADVYDVQ